MDEDIVPDFTNDIANLQSQIDEIIIPDYINDISNISDSITSY
jgi:hypothetical protein